MRKTAPGILRIIDANLNRSREGLRVCEEITRFILNSKSLTDELKTVRHKVTIAGKEISANKDYVIDSRDSLSDVGRKIKDNRLTRRADCADVFAANIQRVKESLRVLEEFSKLLNKKTPARFSALRFRVYDIEKRSIKKIKAII